MPEISEVVLEFIKDQIKDLSVDVYKEVLRDIQDGIKELFAKKDKEREDG